MRNLTAMLIGAQLHRADNDVRESGAELGGGGETVWETTTSKWEMTSVGQAIRINSHKYEIMR